MNTEDSSCNPTPLPQALDQRVIMISIGILAHNEEDQVGNLISDLARQTLFENCNIDFEIHVVANGCTDDTVTIAKSQFENAHFRRKNVRTFVHDIAQAGKSNAWNELIHSLVSPGTEFIFLLDADIRIPRETCLHDVLNGIATSNAVVAVGTSVSDLSLQLKKSAVERLIYAASATAYDTRTAICGQFYCAKFDVIKSIWMPTGLPGEDGFLRAMILTSNFSQDEDLGRIISINTAWHIFESEHTLRGVFRHNIRLAIGTAVNVLLFDHIRQMSICDPNAYVRDRNAVDPNWINELIDQEKSRGHYFLLNKGFLLKRINLLRSLPFSRQIRRAPIVFVGMMFDIALFFRANHLLRRGAGAGFW
jgi:glycosyltransferase involved in cell wall biosynthesis